MKKISFVIPCYCLDSSALEHTIVEIENTVRQLKVYEHEIILIDDYSPDATWKNMYQICKGNSKIKAIRLAKRFGADAALMAGFSKTAGDYIVCMRGDGSTPANELGKFLERLEKGADVVYACCQEENEVAFGSSDHKISKRLVGCALARKKKNLFISNYFSCKRFVIDEIRNYNNVYPYVTGLILRVTKNIESVRITSLKYTVGTSGYTVPKILRGWLNGFTAFSVRPLRIASIVGMFSAAVGIVYGIYTVIKGLIWTDIPVGFSSLMAAIVFMAGMLMLMIGIIGEYIGRMSVSLSRAPQFVVQQTINVNQQKIENC